MRFIVTLHGREFEELQRRARAERRSVPDQAAFLLSQTLTPPVDTSADDVGEPVGGTAR